MVKPFAFLIAGLTALSLLRLLGYYNRRTHLREKLEKARCRRTR
jgi:hypothetical protein